MARLLPLLAQYGAHYLSGHDHMWQHIVDPSGVQMFQAGAGKECCYDDTNMWTIPDKDSYMKFMISGHAGSGTSIGYEGDRKGSIMGGFMSIEMNDDDVQIIFRDENGDALYVAPVVPRRNAATAAPA